MTDDQLLAGFEAGTLAPERFGHREHVRLAWCCLTRFGRAEAERRLLEGLRAFAARAGKPEKFDAALTSAWVASLAAVADALGPSAGFETLVAERPDVLDPAYVRAVR